MPTNDSEHRGRFVKHSKVGPAIHIDCSTWAADIPADQWMRGSLVKHSAVSPPIEVDCSGWPFQAPQLRIELTVPPDADAETLAGGLLQLLDLISEQDRELGGAGLRQVAEQVQPGLVVLTLAAVQSDGAGDRMDKICEILNRADAIPELPKEVKCIKAWAA